MVGPIKVIVPDEVRKLAADSLLPVFSPLQSQTISESDNVSDFLDLKKSLKRADLLAKYAPLDGKLSCSKSVPALEPTWLSGCENLASTDTESNRPAQDSMRGSWLQEFCFRQMGLIRNASSRLQEKASPFPTELSMLFTPRMCLNTLPIQGRFE